MHIIAAKAVAFKEALLLKLYIKSVLDNAQCFAEEPKGYKLISGGTDTHLVLIDFKTKIFLVKLRNSFG